MWFSLGFLTSALGAKLSGDQRQRIAIACAFLKDDGKIVEDGSHLELLALNGTYKKLWGAQVGGFLVEEN